MRDVTILVQRFEHEELPQRILQRGFLRKRTRSIMVGSDKGLASIPEPVCQSLDMRVVLQHDLHPACHLSSSQASIDECEVSSQA